MLIRPLVFAVFSGNTFSPASFLAVTSTAILVISVAFVSSVTVTSSVILPLAATFHGLYSVLVQLQRGWSVSMITPLTVLFFSSLRKPYPPSRWRSPYRRPCPQAPWQFSVTSEAVAGAWFTVTSVFTVLPSTVVLVSVFTVLGVLNDLALGDLGGLASRILLGHGLGLHTSVHIGLSLGHSLPRRSSCRSRSRGRAGGLVGDSHGHVVAIDLDLGFGVLFLVRSLCRLHAVRRSFTPGATIMPSAKYLASDIERTSRDNSARILVVVIAVNDQLLICTCRPRDLQLTDSAALQILSGKQHCLGACWLNVPSGNRLVPVHAPELEKVPPLMVRTPIVLHSIDTAAERRMALWMFPSPPLRIMLEKCPTLETVTPSLMVMVAPFVQNAPPPSAVASSAQSFSSTPAWISMCRRQ